MVLNRTFLSVPFILCLGLMIGCSGNDQAGSAGGDGEGGADPGAVAQANNDAEQVIDQTVQKVQQDAAQLSGSSSSLDLTYVTDDVIAAIIVHPARAINSEFVSALVKVGLPLDDALEEFKTEYEGIDPREVEQVTVLFNNEAASAALESAPIPSFGPPGGQPGGFDRGPFPATEEISPEKREQGSTGHSSTALQPVNFQPGDALAIEGDLPDFHNPTAIVRFVKEVDPDKLLENHYLELEDGEVDGLKVKESEYKENSVYHFPDAKTLIIAPREDLKKFVETRSAESDLITELKNVDPSHDIIIVADLTPFRPQLQQASQLLAMFIPPDKAAIGTIPTKTKMLTATGGISHDSLLSVSLVMDSADDVTAVNKVVTDGLAQARQIYELQKGQGLPPDLKLSEAEQQGVIQIADEIVAGISSQANGNRLTITVPKPGDFNKLPNLLKTPIEKIKQAAELAKKRNKPRQIAFAFHNYHDIYGSLPGAGSDMRDRKGLSWRVHLLPLLGEADLYEQFHLDEPWDSEHNKALIAQMPDVFKTAEVTEEGKTAFQVVVSDKTAFEMDKGRRFSEFPDGLSNTILVVEAGPDKADIWTKPGGLEFNEEDPLSALGNVGETFQAVIGDGRVVDLSKTIAPDVLKALLTRNGSEPVGDF